MLLFKTPKPISRGAGVFFYSESTCRYLYLLRNDERTPGCWGLPGGGIEKNETLLAGIERECWEEMGYFPSDAKLIPIQKFSIRNFEYHTFFCSVVDEFVPSLNHEHCGYAWIMNGQYPNPLHPGLFNTVNFDLVQKKLMNLVTKKAA